METYFQVDYMLISFDVTRRVIIAQWLVPPTSEELRAGSYKAIDAVKEYGTGKIVWDTTHLGTIHPDDQKWASTEYALEFKSAGGAYAAFIIPQDIFTQFSVEDTISQGADLVPFAYFSNIDLALEWLINR